MPSTLLEAAPLPKYLDLCQQVEEQIESGELKPGDRLPSFTQMREQYGATTATVERILRTLEKKGLIRREPSRGTFVTARTSATPRGVIGLLTQTMYRQHPYYAPLLSGAQEAAHSLGLEVLLLSDNSVISRDKVDGLLLIGAHETPLKQIPLEMPRVALMGLLPGSSGVVADDRHGEVLAVEHLVALGHRRIAFLTLGNLPTGVEDVANSDAASRNRFQGYQDTMKSNGIKADPRWVKPLRDNAPFRGFATAGRDMMQRWIDEDWKALGCTALLAQNDEVAIQAMQVLQENGYDVPGDVSVVGFDNIAPSNWVRPRLTTVDVGQERVGARAVEVLLDRISNPAAQAEQSVTVLPTELVVRESTAPAPQG